MAVLPRQILDAESRSAGDAHVLQEAVVDERGRHAVAGAEHCQHAEVGAGLNAVLVFALCAFFPGPTDDVR